jgi:hypothetical protein
MAPYPGQNDGARRYSCERFAACRVWTVHEGEAVEDGRVVREESEGKYSYALCNAPVDTPLQQLAWLYSILPMISVEVPTLFH